MFDCRTNRTPIDAIGFDWVRLVFGSVSFDWLRQDYLCARSQLQTQSIRLGNWKVHQENRNHDLSKKWLKQNSRYAVKVITKGGFISASRSKELNLQLQLQINFILSMRQTILRITRYWLPQSSRKYPGQNTDLLFWINKVSDIFFSISEQACLALCRLHAAWHLCLGSYHTETHGNIYRSLF